MEWIETHIVQIFAVIGALYAAARGVVALTPTPKDDVLLSKVGKVLRRLAAAFGLDFHQGRTAKPTNKPSRKSMTVALLLLSCCLSLIVGCSTIEDLRKDPKVEYLAAVSVFDATVRSLTILQIEGKFDEDETEKIGKIIHKGHDLLLKWKASLDTSIRLEEVISEVGKVNAELIEIELAEGG